METPVTFLVFNRPELTQRVLQRIRDARPSKLLVVCDGPRKGHPTDEANVAKVKGLIDGIDWPCEVAKCYASENMGCRKRVASGLTWAFSQVPETIVLEDDCLPDPSFFSFCESMLHKFRNDERVMHIAGSNLAMPFTRRSKSYWFSHHPAIWGWASWRRAWQHYDFGMQAWDSNQDKLAASFATRWEKHFWLPILKEAHLQPEKVNTWDFDWVFSCRIRNGLCCTSQNNLVENLGFGVDASHTTSHNPRLHVPVRAIEKIQHPSDIGWSAYGDEILTRAYSGMPVDPFSNLLNWARVKLTSRQ